MKAKKSIDEEKRTSRIFATIVVILGLTSIFGLYAYSNYSDAAPKVKSAVNAKDFPSYDDYELPRKVSGYDLENQPMIGDKDAPVTLVEFGDYKCPPCGQWSNIVYPQLYEEYIKTGKVKMHFINYQFLAPDSILAGVAGEIVYKQNPDAFWDFHKAMYAKQPDKNLTWATPEYLTNLVKEDVKGIDAEQFAKNLKEYKYAEEVKMDYENSKLLGVDSTPTVHINGEKVESDYASIKKSIDTELKNLKDIK